MTITISQDKLANMMPESQDNPSFEQLVEKILPQSRLLRVWPLKGGISAQMTAFEIQNPEGQVSRWIVRRPGVATLHGNPRAAEDEFRLLQSTHSLGLATPKPCMVDSSGHIFPTPYLVIEYIEGSPKFAPMNTSDFIPQMAAHLARIHSLDSGHQDFSFLPKPPQGFAHNSGSYLINEALAEDEDRIRRRLESAWPFPQHNAPTLLHGDYWPGNLLWHADHLVAVIDWEDAHLGDPLADLAISRLDICWIFGMDAMHAFTHHYLASAAIDPSQLPLFDLCAALRLSRLVGADLAGWAAFFHPYGRTDITEASIREHYRYFVTQALRIK